MASNSDYRKMLFKEQPNASTEAMDLAKAIAKGRNDPVFFGEYFLGLHFHAAQKVWLWMTTKTRILEAFELARLENIPLPRFEGLEVHPFLKNILCPSNRFGKTFVTAVKHIWYCFYKIGVTGRPDYVRDTRYATLNISPHSLQVDAAYRYIVDIFDSKLIYLWEGARMRNICKIRPFLVDHKSTKREIHFANNSMIKGVPTGEDQASSLAGTQFFYISYDEAPQSLHLRNELPAKIQSRLIDSGGPLDIIGTPEVDKPSHAYYQRIVKYGFELKEGFFTLGGKLADNIFLGTEEKEKALESIRQTDPQKYRQVAFGEFITTGAKLFDTVVINKFFDDRLRSLTAGVPDHDYIMGVDWGFADTGDPTVIKIIDYTEVRLADKNETDRVGMVFYKIVYSEEIKGGNPYEVFAKVRLLQEWFNNCRVIHDSSSLGGVIIKKLLRELNVQHLTDFSIARSPKDEMLFLLVMAMNYGRKPVKTEDEKVIETVAEYGKIRSFVDPVMEEQLCNYRIDDKKLEQDHVMALGMPIWWLERRYSGQKTKVFNLNILASKPEQILSVPKKNLSDTTTAIKTKTFNIKERII